MTKWYLRCRECGEVWILDVSFNLEELGKLYHYCKSCGRNTFHDVLGHE